MSRRALSTPPLLPGYAVIRPLGTGGCADVFLYEQDFPRRYVAVKVLSETAINAEVMRTFTTEIDTVARFSNHPNIVTIYHAGVAPDGRPFFVMEYCPKTISVGLDDQRPALSRVLETGISIAGAIEMVHNAGYTHGDIKPSNILVTSYGAIVLADFGIARERRRANNSDTRALSLPWSAPELIRGETEGSRASEIWSLGATLYTLLTGHSPFETTRGDDNHRKKLTVRILKARYVPIDRPDVPQRLENVLKISLARDPSRRFQSAGEFERELRAIQDELGFPASSTHIVPATDDQLIESDVVSEHPSQFPLSTTVNYRSRNSFRTTQETGLRRRDRTRYRAQSQPSHRLSIVILWIGIGLSVLGLAFTTLAVLRASVV